MKWLFALFGAACCVAALADPHAAQSDARATVQHAFASVLDSGGFRGYAQGNLFGPGLPALAGDVDVVFPDRIHVRTDSIEFIVLPEQAWLATFGIWTPTDRALLPVTAFDPAAMRKAIASIDQVVAEGRASLPQCAAHVFRFHSSGRLPGAPAEGQVRVWLCDRDERPARIEASDARSGEQMRFDFDWARRPRVDAPD